MFGRLESSVSKMANSVANSAANRYQNFRALRQLPVSTKNVEIETSKRAIHGPCVTQGRLRDFEVMDTLISRGYPAHFG